MPYAPKWEQQEGERETSYLEGRVGQEHLAREGSDEQCRDEKHHTDMSVYNTLIRYNATCVKILSNQNITAYVRLAYQLHCFRSKR
jgi:hypothetical protein